MRRWPCPSPRAAPWLRRGLAALACAAALAAQEPASAPAPESPEEAPDDAAALAAFRRLPDGERQRILAALERRILLDPDPLLQSIVSWARTFESYPRAAPRTFHDPAKWAPDVAPARTLVRAGTPAHEQVQRAIARPPFLRGLRREVWYDWASGQIVRGESRLRDDEVFENLLHGYPPGSDAAVAHVLQMLDADSKHRALAAYLEHLYADLDARAYEDVTLYDAWYSGEIVDVPDVDAIPFAVQILKTGAYHSPIPAGSRRTRLYQQIRDRVFEYRKYRTLREAAAAAFVTAMPEIDPTYRDLVPRFQFLYAAAGHDPEPVVKELRVLYDREAFLERADRAVEGNSEAWRLREGRIGELRAMAERLRGMAVGALGE